MEEFVCKKCGNCCKRFTLQVFSHCPEYDDIKNDIRQYCSFPLDTEKVFYVGEGRCAWLSKENLCVNYADRPEVCRNFRCKQT